MLGVYRNDVQGVSRDDKRRECREGRWYGAEGSSLGCVFNNTTAVEA